MRYLLLLILIVGCGKTNGIFEDKEIQFKEPFYGKSVEIFRGKRVIKRMKYLTRIKRNKKELVERYIKTGMFSCEYSGFCMHYSYSKGKYTYGHSFSCDGKREEKRDYSTHKNFPSVEFTNNRESIEIILRTYESTNYKTLKKGTCK